MHEIKGQTNLQKSDWLVVKYLVMSSLELLNRMFMVLESFWRDFFLSISIIIDMFGYQSLRAMS